MDEDGVRPSTQPESDAFGLVLTSKGHFNQIAFAEHARLAEQAPRTPLTLSSHPGYAVVTTGPNNGPHHVWMVAPLGIGSARNAVTAKHDARGVLSYTHGGPPGKVLDVAHWHFEEGNTLNFVGHRSNSGETWHHHDMRGRSFTLNHDGTMSLRTSPDLVLGFRAPDCTLVNAGGAPRWSTPPTAAAASAT